MTIQRYELNVFDYIVQSDEGDLVYHKDHEEEVERLRAALREVIEHADDMNSYDAGRVALEALGE